ncbi:sensor histidine kinase [Lacticaseibacillus jixiensis]|uniref:sensor histidine kinase n=1 Tax=Lacticaseibacillus jixiensis TaxID=3231926 RepID=UPI0036F233EA
MTHKKGSLTIRSLMLIFILFVSVILVTFGTMTYYIVQQSERTMIGNAKSQLNYLDDRLDNGLQSAQFGVASLLDNETLDKVADPTLDSKPSQAVDQVRTITSTLQGVVSGSQVLGSVSVYWRKQDRLISANTLDQSAEAALRKAIKKIDQPGWYYVKNVGFYYVNFNPFNAIMRSQDHYTFLVAGKVRQDYLFNLIDDASTTAGITTAFSYHNGTVVSLKAFPESIKPLLKQYDHQGVTEFSRRMIIKGSAVQVIGIKNTRADGWLISQIHIGQTAQSMVRTVLFATLGLLTLAVSAVGIAALFYFKIYRHLKVLFKYLGTAERGDYTARIPETNDGEFQRVFAKYNDMADQTHTLLENLKRETALRQTAEFRQLQAQINPHFFYNNLLFIMSMAETSPRAVTMMTSHLAEYYRYVTKKNTSKVTLEQELTFTENYLTIMSLRKEIDFFVDYPPELGDQPFMQLILQPLAENAIYHGIEGRVGAHEVNVVVSYADAGYQIAVTDDGRGMTLGEIATLEARINAPLPEVNGSVGLWNANQRLINKYGQASRLHFAVADVKSQVGLVVSFWVPLMTGDAKE